MALRFFVDHGVPRSVGTALKINGHAVISLADVLSPDSPDDRVLSAADDSILVTIDNDFGDIVRYPPTSHHGVIILQVRDRPEVLPNIVSRLFEYLRLHPHQEHYIGLLILVEPHRIRIRT